jgi:hypothetical protein
MIMETTLASGPFIAPEEGRQEHLDIDINDALTPMKGPCVSCYYRYTLLHFANPPTIILWRPIMFSWSFPTLMKIPLKPRNPLDFPRPPTLFPCAQALDVLSFPPSRGTFQQVWLTTRAHYQSVWEGRLFVGHVFCPLQLLGLLMYELFGWTDWSSDYHCHCLRLRSAY